MAKKKFVCSICGHVHEGNSAPDTCPVCQASSSAFTEDRSGRKKGWMHNPNSNTYIIVYSTVMVVIVATLLAVASLSLQKRQAENELQEKKSNILQSLGYSPDENPQEFDRALADFRQPGQILRPRCRRRENRNSLQGGLRDARHQPEYPR